MGFDSEVLRKDMYNEYTQLSTVKIQNTHQSLVSLFLRQDIV